MFLQSGTTCQVVGRGGGGGGRGITLKATLKDVWTIDDRSTLDLLRINTGHNNSTLTTTSTTDNNNNKSGDDYQKQQAYFESVYAHRGDRRADWAGIYTQLTEEHSERYVPNRWDYTTTAELVRLNLRDSGTDSSIFTSKTTERGDDCLDKQSYTTTGSSGSSSSISTVPPNKPTHRTIVLLDLKPQPSKEGKKEEEGKVDVATDIKNHIVEKCPKTSWQRTTLTIPLLHYGGGRRAVEGGEGGDTDDVPSPPLPPPIWGIVAAHPSFQMSEPTLSSIEKAQRLKYSIATTSTVPLSIIHHHHHCNDSSGGIDIKDTSSCTYEVLMELVAAAKRITTNSDSITNNNDGSIREDLQGKTSSPPPLPPPSLSGGGRRMLDDGNTPLLGRLGELGAVVFVWDDEDSLECVLPHELLVRGDNNDDDDDEYGARLFACQSVRRYWRHRTLPITSRTEDVVV